MRLFITALPLAYLCGTIYILLKLWNCLGKSCNTFLWTRIAIMVLMLLIACSLFISIGIRNSEVPFWIMKLLHTLGSVWMVYMFYLILILIPTDIARLALPYLKEAAWFTSTKIFFGATALVAAVLIGGYINYINPKVRHLEISLSARPATEERQEILHKVERPLRIVAISDVHLGYGTGKWLTKRYIDLINRQKPHMVLIAGDLIDNSTRPVAHQQLHLELNRLEAPMGIYMVPGNHEYISGIEACKQLLAETSVKILQDSIVTIPLQTDICSNAKEAASGPVLKIIGRDDRINSLRRKSLETLLAEAKEEDLPAIGSNSDTSIGTSNSGKGEIYTIVLDHQPHDLPLTDSLCADIQISGHTHRGQIWPFNLLTDKLYEQSYGYRKWSHSHIYVSSGLSLWGPPFRIGTNSELVVLEIL